MNDLSLSRCKQELIQVIKTVECLERGQISTRKNNPNAAAPLFIMQWRENGKHITKSVPRDQISEAFENIKTCSRIVYLFETYIKLMSRRTRNARLAKVKKNIANKSKRINVVKYKG